jgi:hypothetical protein
MIPDFNDDGILPSGRYNCTLADAEDRFANNDARKIIWKNFQAVLVEMKAEGLTGNLYLDGSYVTDKSIPNDIEVVLDVTSETKEQQALAILFYTYHHSRLRSILKVDWYPSLPNQNDFVSFFEYIGEKTAAQKKLNAKDLKGILKVSSWQ